ncbi:MAG TPA: hypothetical protein PKY88_07825 [Anaerohalosphaeraceae bacterium]|nr:hypothetical protein [Anaerohalosphaeraceae bacterium]
MKKAMVLITMVGLLSIGLSVTFAKLASDKTEAEKESSYTISDSNDADENVVIQKLSFQEAKRILEKMGYASVTINTEEGVLTFTDKRGIKYALTIYKDGDLVLFFGIK